MRPTSVTLASVAASAWIPVNWRQENFNLAIQVAGSGTNTWAVQYTLDDVYTNTSPTVLTAPSPLDTGSGGTAESGNFTFPVKAVRLNMSAWTNGSATMTVFQGT